MTEGQEKHLSRIVAEFARLVSDKYRLGQKAHGGDLYTMDPARLLNNAIEEALDQIVYLITLRDSLWPSHVSPRERIMDFGPTQKPRPDPVTGTMHLNHPDPPRRLNCHCIKIERGGQIVALDAHGYTQVSQSEWALAACPDCHGTGVRS